MKDVNLSEDTIQKREILMNSARLKILLTFCVCMVMGISASISAQPAGDLLGEVAAEEIIEHDRIFRIYMDRYEPEAEATEYLSSHADSLSLYIFFGNWCRESKKYIPGLMKTLQVADNHSIEATFIGVDDQKKYPREFLNMYDIKYIPTVVVMEGRFEIGRIEEEPQRTIESDLVQILKRHQGKSD